VRVAVKRTVKEPAALNVALVDEPVAGAAPPSKFQAKPVPFPDAVNEPVAGAERVVGALAIVPLGSVTPTAATREALRPFVHAEKGVKLDAGIAVPFKLTASVLSSNVHVASSCTLTDVVVTVVFAPGVGPTKASGPGFGSADPVRLQASKAIVSPQPTTRMRTMMPVSRSLAGRVNHVKWRLAVTGMGQTLSPRCIATSRPCQAKKH
jgi:hypothetical protein